jgi:hypothetical protein
MYLRPSHLLLILLLQLPRTVGVSRGSETVDGVLIDLATTRPIAEAVVALRQSGRPSPVQEVKTGNDGRFIFRSVVPGTYQVVPSKIGFNAPDPAGPNLKVVAEQSVTNLRLVMLASARLSGRVSDVQGSPVKDLPVQLMRLISDSLYRVDRVLTNGEGEYEFKEVLGGKYYIEVPMSPTRGPSIFYPGTASPDDAVPVGLQAGTTTTHMDFSLPKLQYYDVRFKAPRESLLWFDSVLIDPSKGPLQAQVPSVDAPTMITISFVRLARNTKIWDWETESDRSKGITALGNDEYLISNVLPGKYDLDIWFSGLEQPLADGGSITPRAIVTADFDVIDKDVSLGVLASKPRNLSIPVRFTFVDGKEGEASVSVLSSSARDEVSSKSSRSPMQLMNLAAERYNLDFTVERDRYVAIARYGTQNVFPNTLEVDQVDRGVLEIVIDGPLGSVEGIVRDAKGDVVSNTAVVLLPAPRMKPTPRAITDENGRFEFSNLPPGEYRAYAWEFSPPLASLDVATIRAQETRGTPVTVRKGQTTSANVRLIPLK